MGGITAAAVQTVEWSFLLMNDIQCESMLACIVSHAGQKTAAIMTGSMISWMQENT